jgi:hypothetical protein
MPPRAGEALKPGLRRHAAWCELKGTFLKPSPSHSVRKPEAPPEYHRGTPFDRMTREQKIRFILKLAVCIFTFGFVFPNIMGD